MTARWSGSPEQRSSQQGGFDTDIVLTLANWYLDHKQLGRVTVGRINTATAGITTIDLGGAGVIANASIGYTQRGFSRSGVGPDLGQPPRRQHGQRRQPEPCQRHQLHLADRRRVLGVGGLG